MHKFSLEIERKKTNIFFKLNIDFRTKYIKIPKRLEEKNTILFCSIIQYYFCPYYFVEINEKNACGEKIIPNNRTPMDYIV